MNILKKLKNLLKKKVEQSIFSMTKYVSKFMSHDTYKDMQYKHMCLSACMVHLLCLTGNPKQIEEETTSSWCFISRWNWFLYNGDTSRFLAKQEKSAKITETEVNLIDRFSFGLSVSIKPRCIPKLCRRSSHYFGLLSIILHVSLYVKEMQEWRHL